MGAAAQKVNQNLPNLGVLLVASEAGIKVTKPKKSFFSSRKAK